MHSQVFAVENKMRRQQILRPHGINKYCSTYSYDSQTRFFKIDSVLHAHFPDYRIRISKCGSTKRF